MEAEFDIRFDKNEDVQQVHETAVHASVRTGRYRCRSVGQWKATVPQSMRNGTCGVHAQNSKKQNPARRYAACSSRTATEGMW
jgi:hypothetical protein